MACLNGDPGLRNTRAPSPLSKFRDRGVWLRQRLCKDHKRSRVLVICVKRGQSVSGKALDVPSGETRAWRQAEAIEDDAVAWSNMVEHGVD